MLVITRRKNESIVIDESLTVVVLDVRVDKVRLGISCPSELPVYMRETLQSGEIGSFLSYGGDTSSMKVFSRKKNESLCIGSDITIMVVEIRGDKVRLGIEYPKEIIVHRKEVYDAIKGLEQKPAQSPPEET